MSKTTLVAGCALTLLSTLTASDFATDCLYSREQQRDLIDNLGEVLAAQSQLESCEHQQQEALQRFLALGLSYNAAALMAHSQYPCDSAGR
jgi:hypothetical protein